MEKRCKRCWSFSHLCKNKKKASLDLSSTSLKIKAWTARSHCSNMNTALLDCLWRRIKGWQDSPGGGRALHFYNIWGRECHRSAEKKSSTHRNSVSVHFFPKGLWVFHKQSITVSSDGLTSHFLTRSDGSLTLPVGFMETDDSKQTGLIHFQSFSLQHILVFSNWNQGFGQMPVNHSMTFSTKNKK